MRRRTLLTFATQEDPGYIPSRRDSTEAGPLLSALDEQRFDRVIIFARPQRKDQADRAALVIRKQHPALVTEVESIDIGDAYYHPEVWAKLRPAIRRIRGASPQDEFSVLLTADTAEIHVCWVLLVLSDELPARLLNFHPPTGALQGPVLREVRWRDPSGSLTPSLQSLLSDTGGGLYGEAAVVQAGNTSERIFAPRSIEMATALAQSSGPVLIQGEPGTQKSMFAALVHQMSRRPGPVVFFNCTTVAAEYANSALFGVMERDTLLRGKLQLAERGTLGLMNFEKLDRRLQTALFQAVENKEFTPVGSKELVKCNVRLFVLTEFDLAQEVTKGEFNAELFHRLRGGLVRLPPLRERLSELPRLIQDEMERANRRQPRPRRLSAATLTKLESHHWPSNLSELRRVIEQAFLNSDGTTVSPEHIEFDLSTNIENHFTLAPPRIRRGFSLEAYLRNVKKELIQVALNKNHGNQSKAARMLGLTPQAVNKFLHTEIPKRIRGRH